MSLLRYAPSAHLGFPSTSDASTSSMPALGVPLPWLREGSGIEIIELLGKFQRLRFEEKRRILWFLN